MRITDDLGTVALSLLDHPRCLATSKRHDLITIGLALVDLPLAILTCLHRVVKSSLDLLRRLNVLNGDTANQNTGFVGVEDLLHDFLYLGGHLGTPLVQNKIHLVAANNLTHRALGDLVD